MIVNALFAVGFVAFNVGLTFRFGWDFACIISGVILMSLAVVGALRNAN